MCAKRIGASGREQAWLDLRRKTDMNLRMPARALKDLVSEAEKLLKNKEFTDYPGAVNGLQVENQGKVTRIAAAVDASLTTVQMAIAAKADLLIVHHGLFWS